jgi:hypothetical protein
MAASKSWCWVALISRLPTIGSLLVPRNHRSAPFGHWPRAEPQNRSP